MKIPKKVEQIIDTLRAHGFEAYAVGGCVRDMLLEREPDDWDITTSAKPEEVKALFRRTIDTGIAHGTVTIMLGDEGFEVTTYRLESEYKDHRHPDQVEFTGQLKEDLRRRDFTINAMAYNSVEGLIDEFQGVNDLNRKIIRAVGDPLERFEEDALRMFRAIRFAGQLGFTIESATLDAISAKAETICHVSKERIRVELTKLLRAKDSTPLKIAYETGLTKVIFPEFDRMMVTNQNNPHHYLSVGEHTLEVVRQIKQIAQREKIDSEWHLTMLVFAGLLHDVAKPDTKSTDDKNMDHFHGHDVAGKQLAKKILQDLRFDNNTVDFVTKLIEFHDRRYEGEKPGMRRVVSKVGVEAMPYLFILQEADLMAQSEYMRQEKLSKLAQAKVYFEEILLAQEAVTIKALKIDGKDLIQLGISPGPELGQVLNQLLEVVLIAPDKNEKEVLLKEAKIISNRE